MLKTVFLNLSLNKKLIIIKLIVSIKRLIFIHEGGDYYE